MKIKPKHLGVTAIVLTIATVSAVSTAQLQPQLKDLQKAQATAFAGPLQTERRFDRLIVKFKDEATTRAGVFDFHAARSQVATLGDSAAFKSASTSAAGLFYLKSVTSQTHVIVTGQKLSRAELFAVAKQIETDPRVAYAEIDEIVHTQSMPNDPSYLSQQWHYQSPTSYPGGANLPAAWDSSTGSGVVVAVIDTGYRPHADLAGNLLPGYNFVPYLRAGDPAIGPDASDPGDWTIFGQCGANSPASSSSWHGTHVAGTIAAITNNGVGGAGVAFGAKVLPVRVLGACGGYMSDIAAGMQWAAGLSVPGVPINPNKAKVLNLSLGGGGACALTYQAAVNDVRAVGSVVVAATGNYFSPSIIQPAIGHPANCTGVIAVTAHTKLGDHANYADIGPGTAISGPGGGYGSLIPGDGASVYSTSNTGTTSPGADSYVGHMGTSMATPHVAGVAALLASLQPAITPDALRSVLTSSARPFPSNTYCATRTDCGAGLVDAKAAIDRLNSLAPTVAASAGPVSVRTTGSTITFTATATAGIGANTAFSYQWTQVAGPLVTLVGAATATPSFVAPSPGGSYTFKVKVTDGTGLGLSASNQVTVASDTAPILTPIPAQTVAEGGSLSFTALATDAENNPVVFVASGLPAGASMDPATGVFTWNPAGPIKNYTFIVTPDDGFLKGSAQTVSIAVTAPVASGGSGGGGGGSIDWLDLLALLSMAALGLFFGRRQGKRGQNQ